VRCGHHCHFWARPPAAAVCRFRLSSAPVSAHTSLLLVAFSRFLVEHGADAAAQDGDGWTPLHFASWCGHLDVARLLVEHGADAAAQDRRGSTPLRLASSSGHRDLARFLIEHGANAAAHAAP
jgi:ankyrin repeat protein